MTISAINLKWGAARKDAIAVLARARPPLLSLALLIGLNGLPQAWAQTGPTSLLPPSAPGRAADAVTGSGEKIQIQELGTVDPSSSGLLDAAHGGFPPDLWAGSSLAAIRKSLTLLPGPSPWPSQRLLQTRLLLSTATVPAAQPGEEPLIKLRGDRLWALGDLEDLTALLKNVPTPAITPSLRSLKIDTALMNGDAALACEQGTALRLTNADDPFPAKLQVFCQFAAGKTREAGLGVDLLREQKIEDPTFFAAADSLAGIGAGHAPPPPGNPLDLAMVRLAKLPLPDAIPVTLQTPSWLHAMAMATGPATDAKLALAERAEAAGALSSEALRDLYQSVTFSPAELAASLDNLPGQSSPRSHALLFRMSLQQANPNAKALIITKALGTAAEQGSFGSAARLFGPEILSIAPTPDLTWFAYPAARALFAAQRSDIAQQWLGLARAQGLTDQAAAATAMALAPLARLSRQDEQPLASLLAGWRKTRAALPAADIGQRRDVVLLCLLAALGERVPGEEWLGLLDNQNGAGGLSRPVLSQLLRLATEEARLGETVAFALAGFGDLSKTDPILLYQGLVGLRRLGLEADARAIAIEAALANGI